MSNISHSGNVLTIDGKNVRCKQKIVEAFDANGVVVVFLDPDADMGKIIL